MKRATELLLARGRIRFLIGEEESNCYMRIEYFSGNLWEVQELVSAFGGTHRAQGAYITRWIAQSEDALLKVGIELYNIGHPLGAKLLTYYNLRRGRERWEYVRKVAEDYPSLSTPLRQF